MTDSEAMDAAFEAAMAEFLHEFNLSTETRMAPMEEAFGCDNNASLLCESVGQRKTRPLSQEAARRTGDVETSRERERVVSHANSTPSSRRKSEGGGKEVEYPRTECVALRQKEKRLEAERLQQQLKAAVRCRSELIRHMNALLMKVPKKNLTCENQLSCREAQGASLFKTFMGELDSLYAKTDDYVKGNVELSPPETFALKRAWNQDRTLLESTDVTEIQVSFDQTWRVLSSIFLSDPHGTHTAAMTYRLTYTLDCGDTATLVLYCVLRRYVEKDRVVFVWRALTKGQGEFGDLYSGGS